MDVNAQIRNALERSGGDPKKSIAALLKLARTKQRHPEVAHALGRLYAQQGDADRARYQLERAAFAHGMYLPAAQELAQFEHEHGEDDACARVCLRIIDRSSNNTPLVAAVCATLMRWGRYAEAERLTQHAMDVVPVTPELIVRRAASLFALGETDRALLALAEGPPDDPGIIEAQADISNYAPSLSAEEAAAYQRRMGAFLENSIQPRHKAYTPRQGNDIHARIRVGFLSPDFCQNAVANFALPAISAFDKARFEVHAIHTGATSDGFTERFRKVASSWHTAGRMNDQQLLGHLRELDLDVLVELSGHAGGHRLGVLAARCAPIQISYIGYPNTTGLSTIDARIVDEITDPSGTDALATERLLRLDRCFLCYLPPTEAPAPRPDKSRKGVVLGSFNRLKKLNEHTLNVWSRVMRTAPHTRLLIKTLELGDTATRDALLARLTAAGIEAARVDLRPPTSTIEDHLTAYNDIDLALETFPYNGTTTTCEALWMGVPVPGILGDRHASRVTASLLQSVELGELVADSEDEYVSLVASLAQDSERLNKMKEGLRERVEGSSLCDHTGYARALSQRLITLVEEARSRSK